MPVVFPRMLPYKLCFFSHSESFDVLLTGDFQLAPRGTRGRQQFGQLFDGSDMLGFIQLKTHIPFLERFPFFLGLTEANGN